MKISELEPNEQHQWLRKLLEVVFMRRSSMFRMLAETSRMFVLGNGAGVAMVMAVFGTPGASPAYHWFNVGTLLSFVLGLLFAGLALILVTGVALKEAHGGEYALFEFTQDRMERDDVLFYEDPKARKLSNLAAGFTVSSIIFLAIGAIGVILKVSIFL